MEYEEAVELVLSDKPRFIVCKCDDTETTGWSGKIQHAKEDCEECLGWGFTPNPEYSEACEVIGREIPSKPKETQKAFFERIRNQGIIMGSDVFLRDVIREDALTNGPLKIFR